jgi:hypothetical protein
MATGNYVTGGPKAALGNSAGASEREDLANYISMITRDDTPFVSSIGKNKTDAILHEWQTDELRAPAANAQAEGVDYADLSQSQNFRTRLGNYTQIFAEAISVSNTKRKVNQAGIADEFAYQLKKAGTEMRRDLEHTLVHGWSGKNGSGTRTMGGVQSYATDALVWDAITGVFADDATSDFNGVFDGSGTFAGVNAVASILVDIDLADIDEVQQKVYEEGGKSTRVMVSPKNRRKISEQAQLAGSGNVRRNIDSSGKLRQSVDVYESDFGEVMIVPNYVMGTGGVVGAGPLEATDQPNNMTAICYDPMWFNVTTLRPMHESDVGQKGDSTVGMLVEECTFESKNPKGFGLIVGVGA